MRICHLLYDDAGNPWLGGGGSLRAREIYRRLSGAHQITLVCGRYPGAASDEVVDGVRILRVGSDRSYAASRLTYMREAPRALRSLDWDLWVNEFSAFAPLRIPAPTRRRGVLQFFHFVGHHAVRKHPLAGPVAWFSEALVLRRYRHIITISPSVQRQVQQRVGRGVEVDCVYTGVDSRYFELPPIDEPFVLYLGRADIHTKGLDTLVQAFAQIAATVPDAQLVVAGRCHPAQERKLRSLVARAGIEGRTVLRGPVSEEEKCELLSRCRIFCMPSRYEGWGIAAVEAAAAGKPVLGTRVSGLVDAVREGETGVLVEPGDVPGLASQLCRLLQDPEERQRLGRQGRRWASGFGWDRIAADQLATYERICAAPMGAPDHQG